MTHQERDDEAGLVRDAAVAAISGAAPERRQELIDLIGELQPFMTRVADAPGFKLQAGAFNSVILTQRTLDQIWLLGHVAWRALLAYAPLFVLSTGRVDVGSAVLDAIPGQQAEEEAMAEGLRAVGQLSELPAAQNFEWPHSVPRPSPEGAKTVQEQAVAELNVIAAAYIFLHELHHVRCAKEQRALTPLQEQRALTSLEEELECDAFARNFLLDAVDTYVEESKEDRSAVLTKRGAGMALGCFILLNVTQRSRWAGSESHPPLAERLRLLTSGVDVPGNALYWAYLAALLLAVLRIDGSLPTSVPVADWRDACAKLIDVVEAVA